MKSNRNVFLVCALIGVSFLFVGCEYITWWRYRLPLFFSAAQADMLSEGVGYLFQVLGLAAFSLFIKRTAAPSRLTLPVLLILDVAFCALANIASSAFSVLLFGFIMNFIHGVVSGYYLVRLARLLPADKRGIAFGAAYAFGSVGSWLLSLPASGAFLSSPYIFIVYALLAGAIIYLDRCIASFGPALSAPVAPACDAPAVSVRTVMLLAATVALFSAVKGVGFYFPVADCILGGVSAEATRAYYAVGLIAAGIINDKNRAAGAVLCVCALVFPFISLTLRAEASAATALWIMGYVFFGFFSVYRVVAFADIAKDALYIAPLGLLFGRVGDAAGAFLGAAAGGSEVLLLAIASALFVASVLAFFKCYSTLYASPLPLKQALSPQEAFSAFTKRYSISARETDVLKLILSGLSNSEMSAELHITESTVKFHVKNILKKTACANRVELAGLFGKGV